MTRLLDRDGKRGDRQAASNAVLSKFETPEFLLFMVIAFLLWSVGFVDLLAHPAPEPIYAVVGPYSRGVAALLAVFGVLLLIWLALLVIPGSHLFVFRNLAFIQDRNWLALAAMAVLGVSIWHILTQASWLKYPGLSTTVLLFLLLLGTILLLWRWQSSPPLLWRKGVGALVLAVVALELMAQVVAYLGVIPGSVHLDGGYAPHGRIYHNREGFGNGRANNFGWYYPRFALETGTRRVALIGDTYIQALQIDPQQHLGVLLEDELNGAAGARSTEVLALGHPGYGPGLYLNLEMLDFAESALEPDEIIVFIHLGNDLRNLTRPSDLDVYFSLPDDETFAVHRGNFGRWHDVAHYVLTGYEPYHPLRVLKSNYLTPTLLRSVFAGVGVTRRDALASNQSAAENVADPFDIPGVRGVITRRSNKAVAGHRAVLAMDLVETPGLSNFLFEKGGGEEAEEAHHITRLLLQRFTDYARERDIQVRLVTIPVFPAAFYQTFDGGTWTPDLGDYDLFLPEQMLVQFAKENGIPMLAMGRTMLANHVTPQEIQSFFYAAGTGHLTPEGHAYLAGAIYDCFYADEHSEAMGSMNACIGH